MREIVHLQAGQCGNQIGSKVSASEFLNFEQVNFLKVRNVFFSTVAIRYDED